MLKEFNQIEEEPLIKIFVKRAYFVILEDFMLSQIKFPRVLRYKNVNIRMN